MKKLNYVPLYLQVKTEILNRILAGEWPPETFMPNEFVLAEEYGVSQGTLRKALEELTIEKYLIRYQGKGTVVAPLNEENSIFPFYLLYDENNKRVYPSSETLKFEIITPSAEIAEILKIKSTDKVLMADRIRILNEKPMLNEVVYISPQLFPLGSFEKITVLPNTLYAFYLTEFGIRISAATEELIAVMPDKSDIERLSIKKNVPLLMVKRTSYDVNNIPVEYRMSKINSHQYVYKVNLK